MKLGTVEKLLVIGGVGLVVFVIYKMFIAPKADPVAGGREIEKDISKIRKLEKMEPQVVAKLKGAGFDIDKIINTYENNNKSHVESSHANYGSVGKYMSYF